MDWQRAINILMRDRGWSQYDLSDKTGYSQPQIHRILRRDKPPSNKALMRLADAFKMDVDSLLSGGEAKPLGLSRVPLIHWDEIISWLDDSSFKINHWQLVGSDHEEKSYAVMMTTHDMTSSGLYSYPPGSVIVVDPSKPRTMGSRVVTQLSDGRILFRELQEAAGDHYLAALNSLFPVVPVGSDSRHLGTVISTINDEN